MLHYQEEIDRLLVKLAAKSPQLGARVKIRNDGLQKDEQKKQIVMLEHLENQGLIELLLPASYPETTAQVTPRGWERNAELTGRKTTEFKVLLSWSGSRSRAVAEALHDWLPKLCSGVKPWMSTSDIPAGSRWANELAGELGTTQWGILCLTPENVNSTWIAFEAGALSKSVEKARVVPYLFGLRVEDLTYPLAQFQAVAANKRGTGQLFESLSSITDASCIAADMFDEYWSDLKARLDTISTPTNTLTSASMALLSEAVKDGIVKMFRKSGGVVIATNDKNFVRQGDLRSEAEWTSATRDLIKDGLLEQIDSKGEVFRVTQRGRDEATALKLA